MDIKSIFIVVALIGVCKGKLYDTLKVINDVKTLKLNHIDFDCTIFDDSEHLDEDMNIVIEETERQSIPFGFLKEKSENSTETDCEKVSLIVLPIKSVLQSNISCSQNQRKFIQNVCQTILIYSDHDIRMTKNIYKKIECQLVDQPFVFLLIQKNGSLFELFELQVITERMIKLMIWQNGNPTK